MHRYLLSIFIICISSATIGKANDPESMEEAAIRIIKQMGSEDLKRLVKIGPRDVSDFDFNWSDEILHQNQIWYMNSNLRSECWEPEHSEGCNGVLENLVYRNSFDFVESSVWEEYQNTRKRLEFVELKRELFYGKPLKTLVDNLQKELQRYNLDISVELSGNIDESLKMSTRPDIDYSNVLEVLDRVKYEFYSSVNIEPNKILIHSKTKK